MFAPHLLYARYSPNFGEATGQDPLDPLGVHKWGWGREINSNQIHTGSKWTRCDLQAIVSEHIYCQMSGTVHMHNGGRKGQSIKDGIYKKEKQI